MNAFQFDQSAARPAGSMSCRGLVVFRHPNELGVAPSHTLLDAVSVKPKNEAGAPRSFDDYELSISRDAIPEGIEVLRMP